MNAQSTRAHGATRKTYAKTESVRYSGPRMRSHNERSGSRDRRVTDLLFGVHLFASVRPLNACPPEGPEALQACSLFQGTKAWLEPRLEPAELIPALPWTRSAVLVFEQAFFVRLVRLFS